MSYSSVLLTAIYLYFMDVAKYIRDSPGRVLVLQQKAGPGPWSQLDRDWNPGSIPSLIHSFIHSMSIYWAPVLSTAGCRTSHRVPRETLQARPPQLQKEDSDPYPAVTVTSA